MKDVRPRLTREASTAALVAAARELFAERGPSAVSLRDVARRAGVSHGLIHHHIGSRDDLLRLVFADAMEHAGTEMSKASDPVEALQRLRQLNADNVAYSRFLAWSILEGFEVEAMHAPSPALEAAIARAPADSPQVRAAVAAAVVQILGWKLFGGYAMRAAGVDETTAPQLRHELERVADEALAEACRLAVESDPTQRQAGETGPPRRRAPRSVG